MKNRKINLKKLTLSALFLALGFVLPFLSGQIENFGESFLPMHLPVLLCGIICGGAYGGSVGLILPLARSLIFTMPPLFPGALAMSFELAALGAASGLAFSLFKRKNTVATLAATVFSVIFSRIISGFAKAIIYKIAGIPFILNVFLTAAFVTALPGIILQTVAAVILVPLIRKTIYKS